MPINTVITIMIFTTFSVFNLFFALEESQNHCKLKINQSEFIGKLQKTWNGKYYCSFYGIPYARPTKRFELSQVGEINWNGVKKFTKKPKKCLQIDYVNYTLIGSEDCLYLDLHMVNSGNFNNKIEKLNPVMAWIHGGTFNFGSGQEDILRPDLLIDKDIIVITINYRLGPLGFFAYPNKSIPRNIGLKDQITALQWINKYIHHFNGNSNSITLSGWSAGSAAVTYHLYSELSRGLFQKAIAMSGTFLNPWAFNIYSNISSQNWYKTFPIHFNESILVDSGNEDEYSDDDHKTIIKNLKETPLNLVFFNTFEFWFIHFNMYFPSFIPTIETNTNNNDNEEEETDNHSDKKKNFNELFIIKQPPHILINEKPKIDVPLLIGYTSLEENCDVVSPNEFFMTNFIFPYQNDDIIDFLTNLLTDEYFNSVKYKKFTHLRRIADTIYGIKKFTEKYSTNSKNSIFLYKFSLSRQKNYDNLRKNTDNRCTIEGENGAFHGDDVKLLFGEYFPIRKLFNNNKNIKNIQLKMANLWSNFIYNGNPTPNQEENIKWPKYSKENQIIMNINENLSLEIESNSEMFTLWNLIYDCLYYNNCDVLNKSMSNFLS